MEVLTLSPTEAARRLGIGVTLTYRLLRAGRLPAVKVGKRPNYRIPVSALEEVLRNPERLSLTVETGTGAGRQ